MERLIQTIGKAVKAVAKNRSSEWWFAPHMAAASRAIDRRIPLVDLVLEVIDARVGFATVLHDHNMSWWEQHYLAVIAVFVVFIVVSLVVSGTWRRNRSLTSYKPVDSVVAEQELQALVYENDLYF